MNRPGGVRIDLHWALLTEARYVWRQREAGSVWQRATPITLAGERALSLAPEDLVLHLATHFAVHHSLTGLLRQWDLALVLAQASLDWPRLLARAGPGASGGRSSSRFSVSAAASLGGAVAVLAAWRRWGPRAALLASLLLGATPTVASDSSISSRCC